MKKPQSLADEIMEKILSGKLSFKEGENTVDGTL
jgi:hypothetical protein